jgi:dinuclear metal center YbgI/SA1388 family protein
MVLIKDIINFLETIAPLKLQADYDNSGWIVGNPEQSCTGVLTALDLTPGVIEEAIEMKANLIVVHHPPLFKGLKQLMPSNPVARMLTSAIKADLNIYTIHTNLDHVIWGVNGEIAKRIGLEKTKLLAPLPDTHQKLVTFVPIKQAAGVRTSLFEAGAGAIGNYNECSFNTPGLGTFKANEKANPFVGTINEQHHEQEERIEVIFPVHLKSAILSALFNAHPYETVAYDLYPLENEFEEIGAGAIGYLSTPMGEKDFLEHLKKTFQTGVIRHSPLTGKQIQKVALCGGSGKSLIINALKNKADVYVTADLGYHDFFEPDGQLLLADIGHFESEQYTSDLLVRAIKEKFPTFAVLKTGRNTNPVNYFL